MNDNTDLINGEIDLKTALTLDEVWACAFAVDMDRYTIWNDKVVHLKCYPTLGVLRHRWDSSKAVECDNFSAFYKISKSGNVMKSGKVDSCSRRYARNKEDCERLFNGIVEEKIGYLKKCINELEGIKIDGV